MKEETGCFCENCITRLGLKVGDTWKGAGTCPGCGDFTDIFTSRREVTKAPKGKQTFKYYLHDDGNTEEIMSNILEQVELPDDVVRKVAMERPFYEVELECTIDEKGNIKLVKASL